MLCRTPNRNEADLDALVQGAGDSAQHCQRVAFIVGVFKAADDRRCGADQSGKLGLGQAGGGPYLEDLARNFLVRSRLFKVLQAGRVAGRS